MPIIVVWEVSDEDTPIYISTDGEIGHVSIGHKALFNHMDDWAEIKGTFSLITNATIFHSELAAHIKKVINDTFDITLSRPEIDFWLKLAGLDLGDPNELISRQFNGNKIDWPSVYCIFTRYHRSYNHATSLLGNTFCSEREILHDAINIMSRHSTRLYPKGDIQDTLVFCQRFPGLHYPSLLSSTHLPIGIPQRDPRLLRRLRENLSEHVKDITIPTLCEVVISRECPLLDTPKGHKTWVSINQLKVCLDTYGPNSMELVDCWVFDEYKKMSEPFITEPENWLSVTYGTAITQAIKNQAESAWFAAYLMSEEKAFWIRLVAAMKEEFDVTICGYGSGSLSFYCWNGELTKVCEYLRKKAAVLKHWDREIELNMHEMSAGNISELVSDVDLGDEVQIQSMPGVLS